jgi:hypothetical protein
MLELSPPLPILPLLRVAGLSGLNTIMLQMRDGKLRTDIALSMAENLSPDTKDRVIAAIQKCSHSDEGRYSDQHSGAEDKNTVLAWIQKFSKAHWLTLVFRCFSACAASMLFRPCSTILVHHVHNLKLLISGAYLFNIRIIIIIIIIIICLFFLFQVLFPHKAWKMLRLITL